MSFTRPPHLPYALSTALPSLSRVSTTRDHHPSARRSYRHLVVGSLRSCGPRVRPSRHTRALSPRPHVVWVGITTRGNAVPSTEPVVRVTHLPAMAADLPQPLWHLPVIPAWRLTLTPLARVTWLSPAARTAGDSGGVRRRWHRRRRSMPRHRLDNGLPLGRRPRRQPRRGPTGRLLITCCPMGCQRPHTLGRCSGRGRPRPRWRWSPSRRPLDDGVLLVGRLRRARRRCTGP